ncbi:MAG: hypothetical protein IKW19_00195 [Akkermansia sp.]|nr:hypothetical protein [Akkermansia sp.]MBR5184692.1 hypothetical protein [Akkermansia sp.]
MTKEQIKEACAKAQELRLAIRRGVSTDALRALKKKFMFNAPAFLYETDAMGRVMAGQDNELIKLHAAVRDGQREVIMYIEQILNDND